jgi:hypothetical protein
MFLFHFLSEIYHGCAWARQGLDQFGLWCVESLEEMLSEGVCGVLACSKLLLILTTCRLVVPASGNSWMLFLNASDPLEIWNFQIWTGGCHQQKASAKNSLASSTPPWITEGIFIPIGNLWMPKRFYIISSLNLDVLKLILIQLLISFPALLSTVRKQLSKLILPLFLFSPGGFEQGETEGRCLLGQGRHCTVVVNYILDLLQRWCNVVLLFQRPPTIEEFVTSLL